MAQSLYNLTGKYVELFDRMDDFDEETLSDTVESLDDAIGDKFDGYAYVIAEAEAKINAIKDERDRLAKLEKSYANSVDFLKTRMLTAMQAVGETKIKTDLHTFGIRNAKSVSVTADWETTLPIDLIRTKSEPDKTAIKKALESGQNLESAQIIEKQSINIR